MATTCSSSSNGSSVKERARDFLFIIGQEMGKSKEDEALSFIDQLCTSEWLETVGDLAEVSDNRWEAFRVQYAIPAKFLERTRQRLASMVDWEELGGLTAAGSPKSVSCGQTSAGHVWKHAPSRSTSSSGYPDRFPNRADPLQHYIFQSGDLFQPNVVHPLLNAQADKDSPTYRPRVPDSHSVSCMRCGTMFGWYRLRMRHHCRVCGLLVCSKCSPTSAMIPATGESRPSRICNSCRQDDNHHKQCDMLRREQMTGKLFDAAARGRESVCREALASGADPRARRVNCANVCTGGGIQSGDTPLVVAASRGHLGAVRLLLEVNADPSCADEGQLALQAAAMIGATEVCTELVGHGAPRPGQQMIHDAAQRGHGRTVAWLIEHAEISVQVALQEKLAAAMIRKTPEVQSILGGTIQIKDVAPSLCNELCVANVPRCREPVARALLVKAVQESASGTVQLLVSEFGANLNEAEDAEGLPLLFSVMLREQHEDGGLTQLLLSLKAAPDTKHQNATALLWAVEFQPSNKVVVKDLLAHNADVEARRPQDLRGPLAIAASHGEPDVISLLLRARAQVNATHTSDEHVALRDAAADGSVACCKLLLEAKAIVDKGNKDSFFALHAAVKFGHVEATNLLLDANSDPNDASNTRGWSALHLAVAEMHNACVSALLEKSARLDIRTRDGEDALAFAKRTVAEGKGAAAKNVLDILVSRQMALVKALHIAAAGKDVKGVQTALGGGVNPDATEAGVTAMHTASCAGAVDVCEALLNSGASRPTHAQIRAAADNGHAEAAAWCLTYADESTQVALQKEFAFGMLNETAHVKDILAGTIHISYLSNAVKSKGTVATVPRCSASTAETVFVRAFTCEALDTATVVAREFSVNVNECKDCSGVPLLWATMLRESDMKNKGFPATKRLLDLNANAGLPHDKVTPLQWAVEQSYEMIVSTLLAHKANVEECRESDARASLAIASAAGNHDVVQLLLRANAFVDGVHTQDKHGALRDAAANGHGQVCQALLDAKATVDLPNVDGFFPLHAAAASGHKSVVKLLLQHKANIDSTENVARMTPLHIAAANGRAEVCQCLLQEGSQAIHWPCEIEEGYTALGLAQKAIHDGSTSHGQTCEVLQKAAARSPLPNIQEEDLVAGAPLQYDGDSDSPTSPQFGRENSSPSQNPSVHLPAPALTLASQDAKAEIRAADNELAPVLAQRRKVLEAALASSAEGLGNI